MTTRVPVKPTEGWFTFALVVLMAVAAAATALSTYLLKDVVNAAYEERNFNLILQLSITIAVIFTIRGAATYAHTVNLQKIANAITELIPLYC